VTAGGEAEAAPEKAEVLRKKDDASMRLRNMKELLEASPRDPAAWG